MCKVSPPAYHSVALVLPPKLQKAVTFLASDGSNYVNGIELVVDGGLTQI